MASKNDISVIIGGDIEGLVGALNDAEKASGRSTKKIKSSFGEIEGAISSLAAPLAGLFSIQGAMGVLSLSDSLLAMRGSVKQATDSLDEYGNVQDQLFAISKDTYSNVIDNADAFAAFKLVLGGTADASSSALSIIENLNNTLLLSNASVQDSSSFWLQTKQAVASATVQWEELGPMLEANRVFAVKLAEQYGTTIGGLKSLVSEGNISGTELAEKIKAMSSSIEGDMDGVVLTIDRAKQSLVTVFSDIISGSDESAGGISSLAAGIAKLADTAESNADSIRAAFEGIIVAADLAVKGVSFLDGTVKAVAASALGLSGGVYELVGAAGALSDKLGLTSNAADEWRANSRAAYAAAEDLARKSNDAFTQMKGGIEDTTSAEKEYRENLKAELADIEGNKAASSDRASSVVSDIERITKAEKKAAEERKKAVSDMYKEIGVGGEEYFKNEAQKILDLAEKRKEIAGNSLADVLSIEQDAYEKINELSAQAWAADEAAVGKYLDGLTAGFTSAVADVSSDIEELSGEEVEVEIGAEVSPDIEEAINDVEAFDDMSAEAELTADISGVTSAVESAEEAIGGMSGSLSVDTSSIEDMRMAIERLNETPTLDPFGLSRENYQAKIEEVTANEIHASEIIAAEKKADDYEVYLERKKRAQEAEEYEIDSNARIKKERLKSTEEEKEKAIDASVDAMVKRLENEDKVLTKREDSIVKAAEKELEAARASVEKRIEAEKDYYQEKIALAEESLAKEDKLLSAYKQMAADVGAPLTDETYFKAEADALARQAQEWQDLGVSTERISEWMKDQLADLSSEAASYGVDSIRAYSDSLLVGYEQTGNFSDKTAEAKNELERLREELERVSDQSADEILSGQISALETLKEKTAEGREARREAADEAIETYKAQAEAQKEMLKEGLDETLLAIDTAVRETKRGHDLVLESAKNAMDDLADRAKRLKEMYEDAAKLADEKVGGGGSSDEGEYTGRWSRSFGFSSFEGGGYTWSGARAGGVDGKGGRYMLLHPDEVVVDLKSPDKGLSDISSKASAPRSDGAFMNVPQPSSPVLTSEQGGGDFQSSTAIAAAISRAIVSGLSGIGINVTLDASNIRGGAGDDLSVSEITTRQNRIDRIKNG